MKDQNGMKTDKAVSFVTTIKNYGKVMVLLLKTSKTTVKLGYFCKAIKNYGKF